MSFILKRIFMLIKRIITIGLLSFISACSSNYLPKHSCSAAPEPDQDGRIPTDIRSERTKNKGCSELDAAIDVSTALLIESTKGNSCKSKKDKARKECEQQVQAITDSINIESKTSFKYAAHYACVATSAGNEFAALYIDSRVDLFWV